MNRVNNSEELFSRIKYVEHGVVKFQKDIDEQHYREAEKRETNITFNEVTYAQLLDKNVINLSFTDIDDSLQGEERITTWAERELICMLFGGKSGIDYHNGQISKILYEKIETLPTKTIKSHGNWANRAR